jgi:tight adherence protein C
MDLTPYIPYLASGLLGLSVFALIAIIATWEVDPRRTVSLLEVERRGQLRERSEVYRYCEPLIDDLADWNRGSFSPHQHEEWTKALSIAGRQEPWKPEEFFAARQLEAILAGGVVGILLGFVVSPVAGFFAAAIIAWVYQWQATSALQEEASLKKKQIRKRLPFAIDLMALTLEAGATFPESMAVVVRENKEHPLGIELADVVRQVEGGLARRVALDTWQQRLGDTDISDFVFAVNKGEELGTPLALILRTQADQIRLKQSQWGERDAGEAQVQLVFPGMVVMLACMLVVLAPMVLPAVLAIGQ